MSTPCAHGRSASPGTERPVRDDRWTARRCGLAAAAFMLASCDSSMDPATLVRDRIDYGAAAAESSKRQTLLNNVKLRFLDLPMFVDVGQIVIGYTLETGLDASDHLAPVDRGNTISIIG